MDRAIALGQHATFDLNSATRHRIIKVAETAGNQGIK